MSKKDPKEQQGPKAQPASVKFLFGGLSGMMAISIVQPMDLLKTRMQLLGKDGKGQNLVSVARGIIRTEGILGLYNGLSAGLVRQATYTTTRLGCFNNMFEYYKKNYGTPHLGAKMLMGTIAGGIGAFVGTPAEVALIRMTADGRLPKEKRRNYTSVFNALGRIVREEGVLTLWRGAMATVTRAMVVNCAQLSTYAQAREMLLPKLKDGLLLHFCSSMLSGFVTAFVSMPVDIIKTRVQNAAKGTSQIQTFRNILKNEGILGLWRGFWPTYCKIGPHTVFTFIFLEQLNGLYNKYG